MSNYTAPFESFKTLSDERPRRGSPEPSKAEQGQAWVQAQAPAQLGKQETVAPTSQTECLEKHSQSKSSFTKHNFTSDPVQPQLPSEIPFQSPFQNTNQHYEQPIPQSYLRSELRHMRDMVHLLQSQLHTKELETYLGQVGREIGLQLQSEQLEISADENIQDSQFEDLQMQVLNSQSSTEGTVPIQALPELIDAPRYSPRFELDKSNADETGVRDIQRNMHQGLSMQQQASGRKIPHSNHQNPPKRLRLAKSSTKSSDTALRCCPASNVSNSDAFRIMGLDTQLKCITCEERFAEWHELRTHFRVNHASAATKSRICQECLMAFCSAFNLRQHWERAHKGELGFVCDVCGARFSKKRNRSVHQSRLHPDKRTVER